MDHSYWHKQTQDQPYFEELVWSRPENKRLAGKLLIIGGNAHSFATPAEAFQLTQQAGIGVVRVLLPDALQKTLGRLLAPDQVEFSPSTPSGSFSQLSLASALENAAWADSVLLAGDLGRNAETAIMFEKFVTKHSGQLTVTKDAADYAIGIAKTIANRPDTTLVVTIAQLQKFGIGLNLSAPIAFNMDLVRLVEVLHEFTTIYPVSIITKKHQQIVIATNGRVSTTALTEDMVPWRVKTASASAVWWLQNPNKQFEAQTTAITQKPL